MDSAVALNLYARWGVAHVLESSACKAWQAVPRFVLERFSPACRLPLPGEIAAALDTMFSGVSVIVSLNGLEDAAHAVQGRAISSLVREVCLVHAVAHALSQPILDMNQGPLVVVLVASAESAASACETLAESCDSAGLLLHDTTSGLMPVMPQHRRPDIAIGTPRSFMEFVATRFYAGARASLMLVLDPIELVPVGSVAAWDAMQQLFASPRQVVGISRVVNAEQSSPTALWASKRVSALLARTPKVVHVAVPEPPSSSFSEAARRRPRAEETAYVLLWNLSPGDEEAFTSWPAAIAEELALDDRGRCSLSFVGLDVAPNALGSANALDAAAGLGLLSLKPLVGMRIAPGTAASRLCRSVSGRVFGARRLVASVVNCDPCEFDVDALATVVPRTLLFRNCSKLSSATEVPSPRGVTNDIVAECTKFGAVTSSSHWISDEPEARTGFDVDAVEYHDGFRIFVQFDCFMGAEAALSKLHGVKFDDLVLHVTFLDNARYSSCDFAPSLSGEEDLDSVELM